MVCDEVIKNRRNLIAVWLGYKKAFVSVPHSWIIESLKLAKLPDKIIDVIKMLMSKWRTKIYLYGETESIETSEIEYHKGILQGDMLRKKFCLEKKVFPWERKFCLEKENFILRIKVFPWEKSFALTLVGHSRG